MALCLHIPSSLCLLFGSPVPPPHPPYFQLVANIPSITNFPLSFSHFTSIHPFIHWSTSSALPPAIFPPFINHSLPFILSSCCGKRSSMKCQENRDRRKMPTNPGDMLQGHNFNQSRKISVPIRRWLEIKLYKLTLYARRTWTVNNETIWRNQMAQRPTVTQMSRKFESHAFTLPFIIS